MYIIARRAPRTRITAALSLALASTMAAPATTAPALSAALDLVSKGRTVTKKVESVEQEDGDGAAVRRSIGRPELKSLDPFVMLDEFNVRAPAGFSPHPHRGQSTVTYMLDGAFEHEDHHGHRGTIGPGDLQWMTAGRGIVHSEMPHGYGHGLQLWINLPREHKLVEPDYQELLAKDVPTVSAHGVKATVIAGKALGVESPVRTKYTPTSYLDFQLEPGAVLTQHIPKGWNSFLYVLTGDGWFGCDAPAAGGADGDAGVGVAVDGATHVIAASTVKGGVASPAHHTLVLSNKGDEDGVVVKAGDKGVRFVLLAGKPLKEPVVQYGPFLMTTGEEIEAAFADYRAERNGFEGTRRFMADWNRRHGVA